MKVSKSSENITSLKTLILQLKLSLELSQIQEIISIYGELLLLFAYLKNEQNLSTIDKKLLGNTPTNSNLSEYAQECNDAQLDEVKRIQKEMGYDFDVSQLNQKTVGKRLKINQRKACLVTSWMIMYVLEGATVEQAYQIMEQEVKNGNIRTSDSWMGNQLDTSESMAKLLKGDNYEGLFLQSPWKNRKQILLSTKEDFLNSEYKYAFVKYSSTQSNEFHYTLLVNNNSYLSEYDPYPRGISSSGNWNPSDVKIVSVEPKGWYRR